MSKQIPVLGFETDCVRGVRLAESGKELARGVAECWPVEAAVPVEAADGEEGTASAADADTSPLVSILKEAVRKFGTHEFALALPLADMLVKTVRVAPENRDMLADEAGAALAAISPFPDEELTTGLETVSETDTALTALAAALPESSSDMLAEALAAAKVRVVRVDVSALGWLRTLWPRLAAPEAQGAAMPARRLVLLDVGDGGWDLVVCDDGAPVYLRGLGEVTSAAELGREVMLSLLETAADGREPAEIVVFAKAPPADDFRARLEGFAPVRVENVDDGFGGVEGCARRSAEGMALDATPAGWAQVRDETRYKHRLAAITGIAAGVWLLVMGVLYGVPFGYDWARDAERAKCKRHAAAYKQVKDMRDKVKLVQRYSDHARGALEMLKAVTDRMPEGITLTSFQYKRGESVHVTGEAEQPTDVYAFKEKLEKITLDDAPVFPDVRMPAVSGRGGKNKFDISASFTAAEEGK